ncbi:hypothetical protein B0H66DRAFT_175948 [Apodospora peruviana]|uniref:RecQ-mediated genome instability protein 1 n=1 Tax=Apodospora peruviana TaxID=516989 RepID=A0AAE0M7M7_9PEZI|nr:hypothetical protein B0H66DRAFT_175948 [Apodospora peruviana]
MENAAQITASQLQQALRTQSIPVPSHSWLQTLVSSSRQQLPLASLIATARTRLLASDLTTRNLLDSTYIAEHTFPSSILPTPPNTNNTTINTEVKETCLGRDIAVQVLDIENLNRSRWEQVEELEAIERGEQTRGRQVIRLPTTTTLTGDGDDLGVVDESTQSTTTTAMTSGGAATAAREQEKQNKNATHKLVLQDAKGAKMFALELRRIDRIAVGKLNIGEKMLLRAGTVVARGVLLLEPATCQVLGGKVELWHKAWVEGRLARLKEEVGADRR